MAVVDRGGPWLAIWVNGNIRNLDQPAENYMQPYSMRRSGKTSALEDKQSSAMETKQNMGGAKPKWKTSTRAFLPSKNLGVYYILYNCTIVRWYNGNYQRQLSTAGKKMNINGRQRRLRLCSPNAPAPVYHHHHFLCRESIVKCLKSYCCPWCFLILNDF